MCAENPDCTRPGDHKHWTFEDAGLESTADVGAFLASPMKSENAIRMLHCRVCGAIVYIRFGAADDGMGNPVRHNQYHRERGEA